ncbi:MAG TPA: tetratricopeptide repeat protein [Steroidobacteraceae bacterium]|nr:tetratricopeptide repeat protein [Steroidobacteraceae bacterium]
MKIHLHMSSSHAQLAHGNTLQQQGRFGEAAATLRQLLASEPQNAQALHLLGITVGKMGTPAEAVELIRRAITLQPANPLMHTNLGNALAELGRNAEAVAAYEQALALRPDLTPAHQGRAAALLRLGRTQEALTHLNSAQELAPDDARVHNDLGAALQQLGRSAEALQHFERALTLQPRYADAYHNRSLVEMSLGRYAQALLSVERALEMRPGHAALLAGRGNALLALGRGREALASYEESLALAPADVRVHHQRGLALLTLERYGEALASFERALALAGDDFAVHFHRGVALALLERHEEAVVSFDRALALNPRVAQALNNRGVELGHLARPAEALADFTAAVLQQPDYTDAYANAANTLMGLAHFSEALDNLARALAIDPGHAPSLWSKALIKLAHGEFQEGWPLYEARLRVAYLRPYQQRSFAVPRWSGSEPLAGKTILIHAEQGLGDTLQFCRYIPLLEARGAQVVFEVPAALMKLMRSFAMRGVLLAAGEPLPDLDCHCPLLSLPLAFRTAVDTIPGGVPYVAAAPQARDEWRARLRALSGLKIGLNWQGHVGSEKQPWIRGRSFALSSAAPLARLAGVSLVSLQKGPAAEQRIRVEFGGALAQLTDPLDTGPEAIVETAALMQALDLVVTSDTSVAHLAGAVGVPVWVVLQAVPDWRWMLERSDSPWYPSMRLYRQRIAGDWGEVFERLTVDVEALLRARHPQPL